jgi:hypothetical protein
LLLVRQRFFCFGFYFRSLFGAWLAFFAWWTRLARLTLRAFCASFFASGFRGVEGGTQLTWLALFAWFAIAAFARLTWWACLADFLWLTNLYVFTWLTLFARGARRALFTRLTLFAGRALFTGLALFVATTAAAAILLATIAALIIALWALAGFLLYNWCGLFFFLAGKQANQ